MTVIIDYDAGNIRSVEKACRYLGRDVTVSRDPAVILNADHIILPGVGAFGAAMKSLEDRGLDDVIKKAVSSQIPFLGICLGLQLLYEESEESPGVKGLGILKGKIKKFEKKDKAMKIPHMGWNSLDISGDGRLFQNINGTPYVYFVHSYYLDAEDKNTVKAFCDYGCRFDASVESGNVFACQFHPEKSGKTGLQILSSFFETE